MNRLYGAGVLLVLALGCGKTVARGSTRGAAPIDGASASGASVGGQSHAETSGIGGVAGDPAAPGAAGVAGVAATGGAGEEEPMVVSGKVVDLTGYPLAGRVVEAQGQRVTTAEDGTFELLVTPPYDVVLRVGSLGTFVYLSVTRSDPTLRIHSIYRSLNVTTVKGQVSGGLPLPLPENQFSRVYVSMSQPGLSLGVGNDGAYGGLELFGPGHVEWSGDTPRNAQLLAVQGDVDGTTPAQLLRAVGIKSTRLIADGSIQSPEADIVLAPPRFRELEVELVFPDGPPDSCAFTLKLADDLPLHVRDCSRQHRILVPDLGDFKLALWVQGDVPEPPFGVFREVPTSAESVSVTVPKAFPVIEAPLPNAFGKASELAFEITPAPGAVTLLVLDHADRVPSTYVYTTEARVELTRLLELDSDLPARGAIEWSVEAHVEAATVDEQLAPSHRMDTGWSFFAAYTHHGDWNRFFSYEAD